MPGRKPIRFVLITLALAAATSAGLAAVASQASARGFSTGVLDVDAFSQSEATPFARTRAAGARFVKRNIHWPAVAPGGSTPPPGFNPADPGDPHYRWAEYDRFVQLARANGLEPILNVTNSPAWARDRCTHVPECAPRPAPYAQFARVVAQRYSGTYDPGNGVLPRVRHFQAWVEPNLDFFFKPVFEGNRRVSPDMYRPMLNAFYDAIHSVRRDNVVISAGLAPLGRPGTTIAPLEFMRRLMCMRGRRAPRPQRGCNGFAKFDVLAVHPYTTGGPTHSAPGPDDVSLGDLHKVTRLLRAAERAGKVRRAGRARGTPIWTTEFSYDSNPPDPGGLRSFVHVHWSSEAMFRMYKAGIETMIWFGYRDEDPEGRPHCEVFDSGLHRRGRTFAQDRPKPFMRAFRFPFVSFKTRRGLHVWGRTPDSRPGPVLIQLRNGRGGFRSVQRVRARAGGVFEAHFRVRGRVSPRGAVRARAPRGRGLSVPYSLRYVRHFYQPPFGRCVRGGGGSPR